VLDFDGQPSSLLRFLLLAMARIPFDQSPTLSWSDGLPMRMLLPGWSRPFADIMAVAAPGFGTTQVDYQSRRAEGSMHIDGVARGWKTHVEISLGTSSHRMTVEHGARKRSIELRFEAPDGRRDAKR